MPEQEPKPGSQLPGSNMEKAAVHDERAADRFFDARDAKVKQLAEASKALKEAQIAANPHSPVELSLKEYLRHRGVLEAHKKAIRAQIPPEVLRELDSVEWLIASLTERSINSEKRKEKAGKDEGV